MGKFLEHRRQDGATGIDRIGDAGPAPQAVAGGLVALVASAMVLVYTCIPTLNVGGNLPLAEWMF